MGKKKLEISRALTEIVFLDINRYYIEISLIGLMCTKINHTVYITRQTIVIINKCITKLYDEV